ncbi:hypothetical protein CRV24_003925 [Beauveria bassiana]|nr:hypothetical protein CRV24_003925 [Beauveria bassiana]
MLVIQITIAGVGTQRSDLICGWSFFHLHLIPAEAGRRQVHKYPRSTTGMTPARISVRTPTSVGYNETKRCIICGIKRETANTGTFELCNTPHTIDSGMVYEVILVKSCYQKHRAQAD